MSAVTKSLPFFDRIVTFCPPPPKVRLFRLFCPPLRYIRLFWKIFTFCPPSEMSDIISNQIIVTLYPPSWNIRFFFRIVTFYSTVVPIFGLKSIARSNCFSHDFLVNVNVNSFRRKIIIKRQNYTLHCSKYGTSPFFVPWLVFTTVGPKSSYRDSKW